MTHPFHPLAGREFELVERRRGWRGDRVYLHDVEGELVSLPAGWTDVVPADPFVVVAAERSPFHVEGLLELAELVARLTPERSGGAPASCQADYAVNVETTCRKAWRVLG